MLFNNESRHEDVDKAYGMSMKKILIVDDSETSILFLSKMLSDYEVISALNGVEMWERLTKHTPSLILMDVMLPDTNGYELVEKLYQTEKFRDIPIIFQTAKNSSEDLEKGFEVGAVDYIRKPIDKIELRARIKSVLKIKELEKQLYIKTITDYLTETYNRRYFYEIAEKHFEFSQRFKKNLSIGILDIDLFKKVNDTYGHSAGDLVLKKFSEILKTIKRSGDIVARYGGEEFIMMFFDTDKSIANEILLKIQAEILEQRMFFQGQEIAFTFSAGIVDLNEISETIDLDDFIKIADARLYNAKETGRNKIVIQD